MSKEDKESITTTEGPDDITLSAKNTTGRVSYNSQKKIDNINDVNRMLKSKI